MMFDGQQHVGKAAEHVRPDRLALVGAGDAAHRSLVGRDAEMVGPEHHEPLEESGIRGRRVTAASGGFLDERVAADFCGLRRRRCGAGGRGGRWRRGLLGRRGHGPPTRSIAGLRWCAFRSATPHQRARFAGGNPRQSLPALGFRPLGVHRRGKGDMAGLEPRSVDADAAGLGQRLQDVPARVADDAPEFVGASAQPETPQRRYCISR